MADLLLFTSIPVAALLLAHGLALAREPGASLISLFQHFAAGVVFAAVALELLPALRHTASPAFMTAGFLGGVAAMLILDEISEKAGMVVPLAVDLFIDGLLVAIGFAAGKEGGLILLAGLTLETASLGLSIAPSLQKKGIAKGKILGIALGLGAAIWVGSGFGYFVAGASGKLLAAILGFGVAALLYLVTEELLADAHEQKDTPIVTASFFVGFLLPFLISFIR